jgi:hypothetical protein
MALQAIADGIGVQADHRGRAQYPDVLVGREPQPEIGATQPDCRILQQWIIAA